MSATAGTTTIELPLPLRERLQRLKTHPRQPYHEVVLRALDALEMRTGQRDLDAAVRKHASELRKAARRHGIERLWLFGSRARGEARPDSDFDFLYRAPPRVDAWNVSGFLADAEDILGAGKVDIVDIDRLPERLKHVVDDAVPL